jgi:hypothetical protein
MSDVEKCPSCDKKMNTIKDVYSPEKYKINCEVWSCDCGTEVLDNNQESYINARLVIAKNMEIVQLESKLRIAESAIAYKNEINSQLENKLRVAVEALEFYDNEDNWILPDNSVPYWTVWDDGDNIGFHKAREALQKIRGDKDE